ncbi:MAG: hypothetical protein KAJ19_00550 [Gammaproteobacteria bacterium]|nr:hypothetical protein [Gammaproteobacteria bacterium]
MTQHWPKIILTIFLLLSALLAGTGAIDSKGETYIDETLTRSLVAFGVARGLNGVISVAQGTEIALQPAGIGINFTPGQILDPVNDLIERFSWVMLASSASLGVQQVLLSVCSWYLFSWFMIGFLSVVAVLVWVPSVQQSVFRPLVLKSVFLLIFIRFAVPMMAITSEFIYEEFLSVQYTEAAAQLEKTTENIGQINRQTEDNLSSEDSNSAWSTAKELYRLAASNIDIGQRVEQYKKAAENVSRSTVDLIVVFVFQTILLPLIFLLLAYLLIKALFRYDFHSLSKGTPEAPLADNKNKRIDFSDTPGNVEGIPPQSSVHQGTDNQ